MKFDLPDKDPLFPLSCGDPQKKSATFSRFVLPFSWKPISLPRIENSSYFRKAEKTDWISAPDLKDRRDPRITYFTEETGHLLYKMAEWFVLEGSEVETGIWSKFLVKSKSETYYEVHVRAPAAILFGADQEWKDSSPNPLQNGLLVLECFFPGEKPSYEDLLKFNECFRYWSCPHENYKSIEIKKIQNSQEEISISLFDKRWLDLLKLPFLKNGETAFQIVSSEEIENQSWLIQPDDRAFTLACVITDQKSSEALSNALASPQQSSKTSCLKKWISLLNIDSSAFSQTSKFEEFWILERSYTRWSHFGTLHGFSLHSAVVITAATTGIKYPHGNPPICWHFATLYSDITFLLIYIRCCLFHFRAILHEISREIYDIDNRINESERRKKWQEKFQELRWKFMIFENLYRFPLVSNQQQAIEMYEMQQKVMDIQSLHDELSAQIRSSDELLKALENQNLTRNSSNLNIVAFWGLSISILLSTISLIISSCQIEDQHPYAKYIFILPFIVFLFISFKHLKSNAGMKSYDK